MVVLKLYVHSYSNIVHQVADIFVQKICWGTGLFRCVKTSFGLIILVLV